MPALAQHCMPAVNGQPGFLKRRLLTAPRWRLAAALLGAYGALRLRGRSAPPLAVPLVCCPGNRCMHGNRWSRTQGKAQTAAIAVLLQGFATRPWARRRGVIGALFPGRHMRCLQRCLQAVEQGWNTRGFLAGLGRALPVPRQRPAPGQPLQHDRPHRARGLGVPADRQPTGQVAAAGKR